MSTNTVDIEKIIKQVLQEMTQAPGSTPSAAGKALPKTSRVANVNRIRKLRD